MALHLEDWLTERQENLAVIADAGVGRLDEPAVAGAGRPRIDKTSGDYELIEVTDLTGRVDRAPAARRASSTPATRTGSARPPAASRW